MPAPPRCSPYHNRLADRGRCCRDCPRAKMSNGWVRGAPQKAAPRWSPVLLRLLILSPRTGRYLPGFTPTQQGLMNIGIAGRAACSLLDVCRCEGCGQRAEHGIPVRSLRRFLFCRPLLYAFSRGFPRCFDALFCRGPRCGRCRASTVLEHCCDLLVEVQLFFCVAQCAFLLFDGSSQCRDLLTNGCD